MDIAFDNTWAYPGAESAEFYWLANYLTVERKVFGGPPERICFMDELQMNRFPVGLAFRLGKAAREAGIQIRWVDHRVKPCEPEVDRDMLLGWLRWYQREAVEATIARGGRGLIKVPTGGGKTEIFIALTRVYPCEWLFLVHRGDLVEQTAARYYKRTGERAGRFERGRWERGSCNVTVATFQSVAAALRAEAPGLGEFVEGIQAVNVDEVHSQPAESFYSTTQLFKNAYYRIGQSGTPLSRSDYDNVRVIGAMAPLVYTIQTQTLVAEGALSPSRIRMVRVDQPYEGEPMSWAEAYKRFVVRSSRRNTRLAQMMERADKPSLVFVDELAQGKALMEAGKQRGLRVALCTGDDSLELRQSKIEQLVRDGYDTLICTVIFQEGVDIPELASVVVACGKSSEVACLQRIGRGMRVCVGKDYFEVWDVLDEGHPWFARHAVSRKASYESEGHRVEVVE